jgi:DNA-binding XRE family transcriptional regulator
MAASPLLPLPGNRKELRNRMGITVKQAALEIGVSARTYMRWEQGATPNLKNHRKYGDQLRGWRRATDKIVAY